MIYTLKYTNIEKEDTTIPQWGSSNRRCCESNLQTKVDSNIPFAVQTTSKSNDLITQYQKLYWRTQNIHSTSYVNISGLSK